jgi:hypothetical protein
MTDPTNTCAVSSATPIEASTYSQAFLALVRTLDCAEVCVRAAGQHFSNLEQDDPDAYSGGGGSAQWTDANLQCLRGTLPGLRSAAWVGICEQHPGMAIPRNALGDFDTPKAIAELWRPVIKKYLQGELHELGDSLPQRLLAMPERLTQLHAGRFVVFNDEAHPIPDSFSDGFVEVWFRRALGSWYEDNGAYPAFLVKRPYGWQAYGIER